MNNTADTAVKLITFAVIYGAYYFLLFGRSKSLSSKFILSTIAAFVTYMVIDILFFNCSLALKGWPEMLIYGFFSISIIAYAVYMAYRNY